NRNTGILTEKYFFGEEDFEFSFRLKKKKKPAACCLHAIVYHKIGSTINTAFSENQLGKIFIYYLNRYINMRDYMFKLFWHFWRIVYLLYILPMLKARYRFTWKELFSFAYHLLEKSLELDRKSVV